MKFMDAEEMLTLFERVGSDPEIGDYITDIGSNGDNGELHKVLGFELPAFPEGIILRTECDGKECKGFCLKFFKDNYGELGYKNRVINRKAGKVIDILFR